MVNYQKMCYILCRAASEALDRLPEENTTREAREMLKAALLEAEEIYLSAEEEQGSSPIS